MIERFYIFWVWLLDKMIWYSDINSSVHRLFLSPQLGDFRVALGRVKAVHTFRYAYKHVPAYRDYLSKHSFHGPRVSLTRVSLGDVPEMDKASYIKPYALLDKLIDGQLPRAGVMFDESSGSSGKPTSWVRGAKERRMTQRILQVTFNEFKGNREPIILNTFSMGAWATGFNTSTCLLGIGRIKSIGPDQTKVIDTLVELGPGFDYVILGYPPFLRALTESTEIDWGQYRISALYGGEGMSESMRSHLLGFYGQVMGSYGASDLEINIAWESDFTIGLRRALSADPKLQKLLMRENRGIVPMVFQFNPYDYLFETNAKGELLVTICRTYNLSPRVRYNIHDIGHAMDFYKLKRLLIQHGHKDLLKLATLDFAVLFHYGRADLSVDYNGAVVGPEEIKQILSQYPLYEAKINTFRLISYEDKTARKHLLFAMELSHDAQLNKTAAHDLLAKIVADLQVSNLDFKSAHSTAQLKPEIKLYTHGTGIFDQAHTKLKNDYIWNIDYRRAVEEGIVA